MFSGKNVLGRLRPREVNTKVVSDINEMLKGQHSKARTVDRKTLLEHLGKSLVIVGRNDERVIAMGVLVRVHCVSHSFAGIHNLIVRKGYDFLTIATEIIQTLIKDVYDVEFIEAGAGIQDEALIGILESLRFKEKPKSRYRLRLDS